MREKSEGERGSFTGGELYQRRRKQRWWRWVELVLRRGEKNECESESEGTRVILALYMDRGKRRRSGRGWRPAALPFMVGRLSGVKEQEEGGNNKKLKVIRPWGFISITGALGRKREAEEVSRHGGDHGSVRPNRGKGGGAG
jgi:hypothetical protein